MKFRTLLFGPFFGLAWLPLASLATAQESATRVPATLSSLTSAPRFRFDAGAPLLAPAGVAWDGTVCVGTVEGYVHAIGPDGGYHWSYSVRGAVTRRPLFAGELWYVATSADRVYAIGRDGSLHWVFKPPSAVSSELASDASGTLFFVGADHFLYGVSAHGGVMSRTAFRPADPRPEIDLGETNFVKNQPKIALDLRIPGASTAQSNSAHWASEGTLCDPDGQRWRGRRDGVLEFRAAPDSSTILLRLSQSAIFAPAWSEAAHYAVLSTQSGVVWALDAALVRQSR